MHPEQWSRVQDIFQQAMQLDPEAVPAFLDSHCENAPQIRTEVESLLQHASHDDDELLPPRVPETTSQLVGQRVGPFHITKLIAAGGMGTVYEARQQHPSRTVALKVLHRHLAGPAAVRRFKLESEVLGYLHHRNIAQVYQAGTHKFDGVSLPYFAMEYIPDARPITAFVVDQQLDTRRRIELFACVCDAVHAAHQKSVIHRDLKPQNILVDQGGEPKVIDFGIARATNADLAVTQHTQPGQVIGTAQYMSPEQYDGQPEKIDVRSDVYSLGVVLYELLSGRLPYDIKSTNLLELASAIRENEPIRLSATSRHLRGDIETVVAKAIENESELRYQSAGDLAADLRRVLRNEPIVARPPSLLYSTRKYVARRRWQALAVAATASTLMVAAGMLAWNRLSLAAKEEQLRQENYGPTMTAVEAAIQQGDTTSAQRLLTYAEQQHADLLGWEWRHLNSLADQSIARNEAIGPRTQNRAAVSRQGLMAIPLHSGFTVLDTAQLSIVRSYSAISDAQASCVEFSPDGRWLARAATAGGQSTIAIWEISNAAATEPALQWEIDVVPAAIAFHPSEQIVVCAGHVGSFVLPWVEVWRIETDSAGQPVDVTRLIKLEGHHEQISDLAFSPDGKLLATASWDHTVRLWFFDEILKGAQPRSLVLRGHRDDVHAVAFDTTGTWLATGGGDSVIHVWNIPECLRTVQPGSHKQEQVVLGQPGTCLVLMGHDGNVLDLQFDPKELRLYSVGTDRFVHCWEVNPAAPLTDAARTNEWRLPQYREFQRLRGHGNQIRSLGVALNGKLLTLSRSGVVRTWLPGLPSVPALPGHTTSVKSVCFHPDGKHLLSSSKAEFIVWDTIRCVPGARRVVGLPNHTVDDLICWRDKDRTLLAVAAPDPRTPLVWDVTDPTTPYAIEPFVLAPTEHSLCSIAVSVNRQRLAAFGRDGSLHVFQGHDDQFPLLVTQVTPIVDAESFYFDAEFLDDRGEWLAVATSPKLNAEPTITGGLEIMRVGGERAQTATARVADLGLTSLHRRGALLVGGSRDGAALVWRIVLGRGKIPPRLDLLHRLEGHDGGVVSVCLHPTEPRLLTGGRDGTTRVWNVESGRLAVTLFGQLGVSSALAFDSAGERLAIASGGSYGAGNVVYLRETQPLADEAAHTRRDASRAYGAARLALQLPAATPQDVATRIRNMDLPDQIAALALRNLESFASHPESLLATAATLLIEGDSPTDYAAALAWLEVSEQFSNEDAFTKTVRGACLLRLGQIEEADQVLSAALADWEGPVAAYVLDGVRERRLQCLVWLALTKASRSDLDAARTYLSRARSYAAGLQEELSRETLDLMREATQRLGVAASASPANPVHTP